MNKRWRPAEAKNKIKTRQTVQNIEIICVMLSSIEQPEQQQQRVKLIPEVTTITQTSPNNIVDVAATALVRH